PEMGAFLEEPIPRERLTQIASQVVGSRLRAGMVGLVGAQGRRKFVFVRGVDPSQEIPPVLTAGSYLRSTAREAPIPQILLGRQLAADLGVGPGSYVLFNYVRRDGRLDDIQCRVTGITDEGTPELDGRMATLHLDVVRRLLGLGTGCHQQLV